MSERDKAAIIPVRERHPTELTGQEVLWIADALLRDDCTPETRKAASDLLYMYRAQLASVRAALE